MRTFRDADDLNPHRNADYNVCATLDVLISPRRIAASPGRNIMFSLSGSREVFVDRAPFVTPGECGVF